MVAFLFVLSGLGALGGGLLLLFTIASSMSAPQQAASAAIALGLAVIPYTFARAFQLVSDAQRQRDARRETNSLLQDLVRENEKLVKLLSDALKSRQAG